MGNSHSKKRKREEERRARLQENDWIFLSSENDLASAHQQNASLHQQNEAAHQQNASLRQQNEAIRQQFFQLRSDATDRIHRLQIENAQLKTKMLNGTKEVINTSNHSKPQKLATKNPRTIILDGSNVAVGHSAAAQRKKKLDLEFSPKGLEEAIKYFTSRGHTDVRCILPAVRQNEKASTRLKKLPTIDFEILAKLQSEGFIHYVPKRSNHGKGKKGKKSKNKGNQQTTDNSGNYVNHYDDLYILELASQTDGIVVSNDHYRDCRKIALKNGQDGIVNVVDNNLLTFMFSKDNFVPSPDPQPGVSLPEFLSS